MKNIFIGIIIILLFSYCKQEEDYLLWSDDFSEAGAPNPNKWNIIEGDGCPELCGFGNNELQFYTKENVRVEDGQLIITAKADDEHQYTSAKLTTEKIADWETGYIEVKAKLPEGRGSWPAIWMLPTKDGDLEWPLDGEIDIMEHVGYNPEVVYGTIHTESYNHVKGTEKSDSTEVKNAHNEFNVYAINWTEDKIEWYVNDKPYHAVYKNGDGKSGWPFEQNFHLILNLAVGGNWGGKHGVDQESFPQELRIDYVKVYSQKPNFIE
ncbi:MAG: glycoside hydrolase family 16 protein [Bacteroidota bacterium]